MKILSTSFEKFCVAACLSSIVLMAVGTQAQALSFNDVITRPISIKIQIVAMVLVFLGLKLLKPTSDAF